MFLLHWSVFEFVFICQACTSAGFVCLRMCLLYRAGSCWCCMRCVVPGVRGSSDPQALAPVGPSSCAVTLLHHRRRCSQSRLTTRSPHSRLTDRQNHTGLYNLHFTRYKSIKIHVKHKCLILNIDVKVFFYNFTKIKKTLPKNQTNWFPQKLFCCCLLKMNLLLLIW